MNAYSKFFNGDFSQKKLNEADKLLKSQPNTAVNSAVNNSTFSHAYNPPQLDESRHFDADYNRKMLKGIWGTNEIKGMSYEEQVYYDKLMEASVKRYKATNDYARNAYKLDEDAAYEKFQKAGKLREEWNKDYYAAHPEDSPEARLKAEQAKEQVEMAARARKKGEQAYDEMAYADKLTQLNEQIEKTTPDTPEYAALKAEHKKYDGLYWDAYARRQEADKRGEVFITPAQYAKIQAEKAKAKQQASVTPLATAQATSQQGIQGTTVSPQKTANNGLTGGKAQTIPNNGVPQSTQQLLDAQKQNAYIQADSQYMQNRATYGQKGEELAGMGLTGSGYSDYVDQQAYAAKIGTQRQAESNYTEQMMAAQRAEEEKRDNYYYQLLSGAKTGDFDVDDIAKLGARWGLDEMDIEHLTSVADKVSSTFTDAEGNEFIVRNAQDLDKYIERGSISKKNLDMLYDKGKLNDAEYDKALEKVQQQTAEEYVDRYTVDFSEEEKKNFLDEIDELAIRDEISDDDKARLYYEIYAAELEVADVSKAKSLLNDINKYKDNFGEYYEDIKRIAEGKKDGIVGHKTSTGKAYQIVDASNQKGVNNTSLTLGEKVEINFDNGKSYDVTLRWYVPNGVVDELKKMGLKNGELAVYNYKGKDRVVMKGKNAWFEIDVNQAVKSGLLDELNN